MINIIWDLDGTVIDSMPVIASCLNKTAEQFDVTPWPETELKRLVGPGLVAALSTLLGTDEESRLSAAKDYYRSMYRIDMLKSPVFTGLEAVLAHFKDIGAKQYIATAKTQVYAKEIIAEAGLSAYFIDVYGATNDEIIWDKSDLLAHVLKEEDLKPSDTLMIGDTHFDIQAGRHHNLITLGVLWGYSDKKALERSGAHYLIHQPEDLVSVVKQSVMCYC